MGWRLGGEDPGGPIGRGGASFNGGVTVSASSTIVVPLQNDENIDGSLDAGNNQWSIKEGGDYVAVAGMGSMSSGFPNDANAFEVYLDKNGSNVSSSGAGAYRNAGHCDTLTGLADGDTVSFRFQNGDSDDSATLDMGAALVKAG